MPLPGRSVFIGLIGFLLFASGCAPTADPCAPGDARCRPFVGILLYTVSEPRYVTPDELPDLLLWLDAGSGVTLSGGNVSGWRDRSANQIQLSQGTANFQPLFDSTGVGGNPAIHCDGVDDILSAGDVAVLNMSADESWTLLLVARPLAVSGSYQAIFSKADPGGANTNPIFAAVQQSTSNFDGGVRTDVVAYNLTLTNSFTLGAPALFTLVRRQRLSLTGYLNGIFDSEAIINAAGSVNSAGSFNVCDQDGAVNFYNGLVAEAVIYRRALSDSERANLECHFSHKYGLNAEHC